MRLDRDPEPDAMSNDLRADIVRAIRENISNMYVKLFRIPALSMMYSVRRRPGRPADSRQPFSPGRPGQCETDLGFSGQAFEKPAGFWVPGGACRLSVYSM